MESKPNSENAVMPAASTPDQIEWMGNRIKELEKAVAERDCKIKQLQICCAEGDKALAHSKLDYWGMKLQRAAELCQTLDAPYTQYPSQR